MGSELCAALMPLMTLSPWPTPVPSYLGLKVGSLGACTSWRGRRLHKSNAGPGC